MKSMLIEAASRTDRGLVREGNEDAVATFPEYGLVVLAAKRSAHSYIQDYELISKKWPIAVILIRRIVTIVNNVIY